MKVIAFYLPQFHNIPENDEWWGDGFTEWVNVKKARPLFEGHIQPKIPLEENYYNLLDDDVKVWQSRIAKESGIYGFCYYHYWFDGKLLLEKPMEQMLRNKDIDTHFCISWANEAWTKAWVGENKVLIPQRYGDEEDWIRHFEYLLPFFLDDRYIRIDGKPLVVIYKAAVIDCFPEMMQCWNRLAEQAGLKGLHIVQQRPFSECGKGNEDFISHGIEFQPFCAKASLETEKSNIWRAVRSVGKRVSNTIERSIGFDIQRPLEHLKKGSGVTRYDYDEVWAALLDSKNHDNRNYPGCYVRWDNTPRKEDRGSVDVNATPEKFEKNMERLIVKTRDEYHESIIFLTAWNEWAEGSYIEPDEHDGYGYLNAVRRALDNTGEYPFPQ